MRVYFFHAKWLLRFEISVTFSLGSKLCTTDEHFLGYCVIGERKKGPCVNDIVLLFGRYENGIFLKVGNVIL